MKAQQNQFQALGWSYPRQQVGAVAASGGTKARGDLIQVRITVQTWILKRGISVTKGEPVMATAYTPMLEQYREVKSRHSQEILFSVRHFYEMFLKMRNWPRASWGNALTGKADKEGNVFLCAAFLSCGGKLFIAVGAKATRWPFAAG